MLGLRFLVVALVVLTRRGHAGRVKRSAVVLCIVVVAVVAAAADASGCASLFVILAAAADAMLVAHQVHPATIERNPKA